MATVRRPADSVQPSSRAAWRAWLEANHASAAGIWLVTYKKHTGKPRMEPDEAVEEALCFGWIDSKPRALDEQRAMLWFAPRKAGTGWSRLNKQRVERAIAAGRMTAAGLAKVQAAQRDGSWAALDAVEDLQVPPDLAAALAAHPPAPTHFDAFPRSTRRAILEWIGNARTPETRARRVLQTAQLAADNVRANQWRQPGDKR